MQPRCRTQYQQQSFLPQTIQDWNNLPQTTVETTTIDTFVSRASKPATWVVFCLFVCLFWGFFVCLFVFFLRNANLPFKSDRIISLLIAVAVTEEEEDYHHYHYKHTRHNRGNSTPQQSKAKQALRGLRNWTWTGQSSTALIAWKKEEWRKEAADIPPSEVGNDLRSTRETLTLFRGQPWGDCWETGWSAYGPFRVLQCHLEQKLILNCSAAFYWSTLSRGLHRLVGPVVKVSASRAEDPGFESRLAIQWLPCQAPGSIGSALGLVGPVSAYCDWVR